jgi:eukaryotic-like serine/threonine-protein kinase
MQTLQPARPTPAADHSWGFQEGDDIHEGRFVLRLLGGGTRYEAYLAYDEHLLTLVVVKILRPARVTDAASLRGLAAEHRALQLLNHPVIARGFDGVLEGPRPHIVLEFLDGPRLSTLVRKYGPLPLEQLVPLAVQLCSALHYVHGSGMTHLDVKPRNIIMGASARLIDLSIARTIEEAAALTVPVGTDDYMAPEQCDPNAGITVGPAADIWGLGITLYEALSSELPFRSRDNDRWPQINLDAALSADAAPAAFIELISDCLRRRPEDRPSARELAVALEPFVAALPRRPALSRLRPRWR